MATKATIHRTMNSMSIDTIHYDAVAAWALVSARLSLGTPSGAHVWPRAFFCRSSIRQLAKNKSELKRRVSLFSNTEARPAAAHTPVFRLVRVLSLKNIIYGRAKRLLCRFIWWEILLDVRTHTCVHTRACTPSMLGGAVSRACLRSIIAVPPPLPAASCKSSSRWPSSGGPATPLARRELAKPSSNPDSSVSKRKCAWMLLSIPLTSPPRQSHLDTRLQRARGHGALGA